MPRVPLYCLAIALLPLTAEAEDAPAPLPANEAAGKMTLPEGFRATLFAGEPDVVQPMAFTLDDRGRLWVVECLSYPDWITNGGAGRDRIVILEDTDGDGRFDERTVFWDAGTDGNPAIPKSRAAESDPPPEHPGFSRSRAAANFSGIALGFGGVWLTAVPHFIFIPDRDGDDVPDGPPEVLLDGWDLKAKHNVFNGLTWGPDGWLYGLNGILSNSRIGKPGTPDEKRVEMNCGVWRYHPVRHEFEWVASGTTNPWGLDFDERGQMFITNCVIKHLFHVIPGAHYKRMHGQDLNRHVYGLMESCADHIHWGGGAWQSSRGGEGIHDKPGGGHAHVGCMIYQGDNWPEKYRGHLFTCNVHGNRVNRDILQRKGSGFVAKHANDFLHANDTWFRGLELKYGPDGGVYVTDWCDTGECHDYEDIHRENGRIYKVTYERPSRTIDRSPATEMSRAAQSDIRSSTPASPSSRGASLDLAQRDDLELVALHGHRNEWFVRHARRLLQERAAAGEADKQVHEALWRGYRESAEAARKLRYAWTLHVTGGLDEAKRLKLMQSDHEYVRGWAVQLELEDRRVSSAMLDRLTRLAQSDPSPAVRLYLASGLQRLPLADRWPIAEALVSHAEDAEDQNLPLMIWYGIEPLVAADRARAVALVAGSRIPLIRRFAARRIAELVE